MLTVHPQCTPVAGLLHAHQLKSSLWLRRRRVWDANTHWQRVVAMAVAFRCNACTSVNKAALIPKILAAYAYVCSRARVRVLPHRGLRCLHGRCDSEARNP